MLDGGTIRVMSGRVINAGEEILMAYHTEYWERWAPRARKQGHSNVAAALATSSAEAEGGGHGRGGDAESPGVGELGKDGGGYGRRVRGRESRDKLQTGKKRGRPPKTVDEGETSVQKGRRTMRQLTWTDTGREEYNRVVVNNVGGCGGSGAGEVRQRFERGEGGGVT